jgi:hypothetical protein
MGVPWFCIARPGFPTTRCGLTAASTSDQVHACQMMIEVHTVSIVAKNRVLRKSGRAGTEKRRNEGQETVYKGQNCSRDDIRQPVRSKRK